MENARTHTHTLKYITFKVNLNYKPSATFPAHGQQQHHHQQEQQRQRRITLSKPGNYLLLVQRSWLWIMYGLLSALFNGRSQRRTTTGEKSQQPPERGKSVFSSSSRPTDAEISFQFKHFISASLFGFWFRWRWLAWAWVELVGVGGRAHCVPNCCKTSLSTVRRQLFIRHFAFSKKAMKCVQL